MFILPIALPWIVTAGGFNPVILKVKDQDIENSKKIIDDFENGNLSLEISES